MRAQYPHPSLMPCYARQPGLCLLSVSLLVISACKPKPGPFSDAIVQEYASMGTLAEEAVDTPYVLGKAVAVNTGDRLSHHYRTAFTTDDDIEANPQTLSDAHEKIGMQIRAANPNEVGTVVILKWVKDVVGQNIAGIEFVQIRCEVAVVDLTKRRIVGRRGFAGNAPAGTHRWGSSPESAIVSWINALPRRAPQASATAAQAQPSKSGASGTATAVSATFLIRGTVVGRDGIPLERWGPSTLITAYPVSKEHEHSNRITLQIAGGRMLSFEAELQPNGRFEMRVERAVVPKAQKLILIFSRELDPEGRPRQLKRPLQQDGKDILIDPTTAPATLNLGKVTIELSPRR